MRHRFVIFLFLLVSSILLVKEAHAKQAEPIPEVASIPSPPAGSLAAAEPEKPRLLETGLLRSGVDLPSAVPKPLDGNGKRAVSDEGRFLTCSFDVLASGVVDTSSPPYPPEESGHYYQQGVPCWSAECAS